MEETEADRKLFRRGNPGSGNGRYRFYSFGFLYDAESPNYQTAPCGSLDLFGKQGFFTDNTYPAVPGRTDVFAVLY